MDAMKASEERLQSELQSPVRALPRPAQVRRRQRRSCSRRASGWGGDGPLCKLHNDPPYRKSDAVKRQPARVDSVSCW